ncbi:DoxX family protein [Shimia abyssi]|uniref:DoxX-like protein n=1 Tax=Shimia abyssi TaxID=1662395 RepID=A0A2P8FKN9_9RHOB|nr:DoxX family protein [Shimia abyssi]PSL22282.1 DoxX-like protein [Shimia abyssi]
MQKYLLIVVKALLTLAFAAAGFFKLTGHEMMVAAFEGVGVGQWFRYVTGLIEVGAAIALWVPGKQFFAAGTLVVTMVGAILTHIVLIGGSFLPALVLGLLAAYTLYSYRDQSPMA